MKQVKTDMSEPSGTKVSPAARWLALLISGVVMALGMLAMWDEYAPGRSTRFGATEPVFGQKAIELGFVMMLLGCLPLLVFCRSSRQVLVLGTLLGVTLIGAIFYFAYS